MKKILLSTTMFAGLLVSGAAQAADLPAKAPPRIAAPISEWAGFYIGVHGGYGWGNVDLGSGFELEPRGGLVGGHAGYLWQWGSWVGGLEVDYSAADLKDDLDGITSKIDALGSARGRLGWLWTPNLLAYGTAGVGWAHSKLIDFDGFTSAESSFGWVAGAGLEYQFANSWRLRVEYLHYDFGTVTYADFANADVRVDVVRGALSFKF
jgi:outer membrane immunogenic protein